MEDNSLVVQADRYHALCAMEGRVQVLAELLYRKKELSSSDILVILGYDPMEDEDEK